MSNIDNLQYQYEGDQEDHVPVGKQDDLNLNRNEKIELNQIDYEEKIQKI